MCSRSLSTIFVICLAFFVGVQADSELRNVTVVEGQPLRLYCSYLRSGFNGRFVSWRREPGSLEVLLYYLAGSDFESVPSDKRIINPSPDQFDLNVNDSGNTTTLTLTLVNITSSDGRRYVCESDVKEVYVTYAVNVQGPPRDVLVDRIHAVADEGDRVQFACNATGNPAPSLAWFDKNDNELPSSDGVANFTASLEVSGIITCRAHNAYGQASKDVTFVVRYKPRIATAKRWAVKLGMLLRLTCTITSELASNAYWLKGGHVISESDPNYTLEKVQPRSTQDLVWQLVLKKVAPLQESDLGEYTCHANNSVGSAHSATLVTDLPFNSSIEEENVGSTQAKLSLVTFSVKPVFFVVTFKALNSTAEPKEWTNHVKGNWPASAAAMALHDSSEATVVRVENNYCVQGLNPASLYQIEMKALPAHSNDKFGNHASSDTDTESVDMTATLYVETATASAFTCGDDRRPEEEGANDGKLPAQTRQSESSRGASVNSAMSLFPMTSPMACAIATWQWLVAAAR